MGGCMSFRVPEKFRIRTGPLGSSPDIGNAGAFRIPFRAPGKTRSYDMCVISSCDCGWEHVSVSLPDRCPTWEEMCQVKAIFWDAEDCVVQYHPKASQHINNHDYCLHLWRPVGVPMPTPPGWMVGVKA